MLQEIFELLVGGLQIFYLSCHLGMNLKDIAQPLLPFHGHPGKPTEVLGVLRQTPLGEAPNYQGRARSILNNHGSICRQIRRALPLSLSLARNPSRDTTGPQAVLLKRPQDTTSSNLLQHA